MSNLIEKNSKENNMLKLSEDKYLTLELPFIIIMTQMRKKN